MVDYLDLNGNKLESGIYLDVTSGSRYSFEGHYTNDKQPIFQNENGSIHILSTKCTNLLAKLSNDDIRKKIKWFEKGLKE